MTKKKQARAVAKKSNVKLKKRSPRLSVRKLIDEVKKDIDNLKVYDDALDNQFEGATQKYHHNKGKNEGMLFVLEAYLKNFQEKLGSEGA